MLCRYHPQTAISHFCRQADCQVPLCPGCLPIHLQDHLDNGSQALLEPFSVPLERTRRQLSASILSLEGVMARAGELRKRLEGLERVRENCIAGVEDMF
jgi:hypothetical protein